MNYFGAQGPGLPCLLLPIQGDCLEYEVFRRSKKTEPIFTPQGYRAAYSKMLSYLQITFDFDQLSCFIGFEKHGFIFASFAERLRDRTTYLDLQLVEGVAGSIRRRLDRLEVDLFRFPQPESGVSLFGIQINGVSANLTP